MQKRNVFLLLILLGSISAFYPEKILGQHMVQVIGSQSPKALVAYSENCLNKLNLTESIRLTIIVSENIQEGYDGLTFFANNHADGKKQINVLLKAQLSQEKQLLVLAHEMIHVRQYVTNDLVVDGKNVYWRGKRFYFNPENNHSTPWENEAYREDGLLVGLIMSNSKKLSRRLKHAFAKNELPASKINVSPETCGGSNISK